jgi:hypothetical protein
VVVAPEPLTAVPWAVAPPGDLAGGQAASVVALPGDLAGGQAASAVDLPGDLAGGQAASAEGHQAARADDLQDAADHVPVVEAADDDMDRAGGCVPSR